MSRKYNQPYWNERRARKFGLLSLQNLEIERKLKAHEKALAQYRELAKTDPQMAAVLKRLGWWPKEDK